MCRFARLSLLLLCLVVAAAMAAPPQLVEVQSRKPCRNRIACEGTFTRATFEATVDEGLGVDLEAHGLSLHGPFHTDRRLRSDIDTDHAHRCLDEDYCVAAGQNVTVDVRVGNLKTYYSTKSWLNQVPYEYFEHRHDVSGNATALLANDTAACAPRFLIRPPLGAAAYPCQQHGNLSLSQRVTPALIEAQSGCDLSVADPIEADDFPDGLHRCTGVQCPPCATGSTPVANGTARLVSMHTAGPDCYVMGVRGAPVPFVELDVLVRNHDTGEEASLYMLLSLVGSSGDVYLYEDRRLRVYAEATSRQPLNTVHGPDLEGEAMVVCGRPRSTERLVKPFAGAASVSTRIPVPTRRYHDLLHGSGHQELFWYWLPRDDDDAEYSQYGRRCGDVGVLPEVFRHSTSLLEEVCYENRTCVPENVQTPCSVSEELNAYSQLNTVRAALLGASGSDPSLIESARPRYLPPRPIWNDLAPTTYPAAMTARRTHNGRSLFHALVVEGHRTTPPPVDVRVHVDISDLLLPDPTTSNVIYAQRLDPKLSQCNLVGDTGFGSVHLTYCRIGRALSEPTTGPTTRPYLARVECDASVGNLTDGIYANTVVGDSNVATMSVDLPVGGARGCFQIETPFVLSPTTNQDLDPSAVDPQWEGSCRVTLMDGTFQHVAVGPTVPLDCIHYPDRSIRSGSVVHSDNLVDKSTHDCTFFSSDPDCKAYGLSTLLVIAAFVAALVAAIASTIAYCVQ